MDPPIDWPAEMATLCHDLRSPLNVVLGFADLLAAEGDDAEAAAHILRSAQLMVERLDEVASRLLSGPIDPARSASERCRVLLVEDQPANVRLVERIMAHRPHIELSVVDRAEEALELLAESSVVLVLSDLHLPGMDGDELLDRLVVAGGPPVAMVTADAARGRTDDLMARGAVAVVTKPFAVADLLALVDRYTGVEAQTSKR